MYAVSVDHNEVMIRDWSKQKREEGEKITE